VAAVVVGMPPVDSLALGYPAWQKGCLAMPRKPKDR
jgi:hypothetical protein